MGETRTIRHDWRDIFRAFKMAFDPKKMFLGYLGILASLVWCVGAVAFFSSLKLVSTTPHIFIKLILCSARDGVPIVLKNVLSAIMPLDFGELFVLTVLILGLLAIWSLAGGAITRIAALDYAKDESIRLADVLGFMRRKFWSYFWSPLVPVIGVLFFAMCNVMVGLVGRIPVFGEIAVAFGFPLAIVSGFLMVFIGVIGVLGLCFMFPTISAEGSDAFDAMSRAYSYVLSRPKQFAFYCFINSVYGIVCLTFVAFAAWLVVRLSFCTVSMGMGQKFSAIQSFLLQRCSIACFGFCTSPTGGVNTTTVLPDQWSLKFFGCMLILYVVFIKLVVWTFATTYLLSAKTIIYFLLRKEIDSTDVSDVYIEENKEELRAGILKKGTGSFSLSDEAGKEGFSEGEGA